MIRSVSVLKRMICLVVSDQDFYQKSADIQWGDVTFLSGFANLLLSSKKSIPTKPKPAAIDASATNRPTNAIPSRSSDGLQ